MMADRYEAHIIGCFENAVENAVDGVECHISAVTVQGAIDLLKEYSKTEEEKQAERKQKRREWQAKYRETHRQQAYQTTKEWRKNNPDKVKEQRKRYRERQKQLGR